ncbi:MAG: aspartyl protease family protein [Planctomycetaceae bacterium]
MGRFAVEFTVVNNEDQVLANRGVIARDEVRRSTLQGVVDTGATRLVLPEEVADRLGFVPAGEATVRYADQRTATRRMAGEVRVRLLDREGVFTAVLEPNRTTALIGAIVLEDLDLVVDCTTQTLHPRDPHRIVSEIE